MTDYASARRAMVDTQIHPSSVTDGRLLSVLRQVPRELFVPEHRRALAYSDAHHPLGNGRFLPAPATFARLVQLADIAPSDRVLDFACGTGYSTAVLAGLAEKVIGFEPDPILAETATSTLSMLGIDNATVVSGDFRARDFNTFNVIMIEGAVDQPPRDLLERLAMGGRLVCLLRQGPVGLATVHMKTTEGVITRSGFNATLPPLSPAPAPAVFEF